MSDWKIAVIILGGLWVSGVIVYVVCWIKTKTWPFQLSDDELIRKALGFDDKTNNNNNNASV